MLLHERIAQQEGATTVGELYEVTKKPRGLDLSGLEQVPFVPMDAIPQGGAFAPRYDAKPSAVSGAGTYFEKCDLLVGKITPSFENGKQALVCDMPAPFGFATTEVIPLRPTAGDRDRRLLFYYLLHPDIRSFVAGNMEGATGRKRVPEDVLLALPFPAFDSAEEHKISECLSFVRACINVEEDLARKLVDLKRATMRGLFSRGLRGESRKDSEIGPVPESWHTPRIDDLADLISTRMTYGALLSSVDHAPVNEAARVLGIKVADMNPSHATTTINDAQLVGYVAKDELVHRCAPPGTIVFPKNGAAVATNKKRMLGDWGVFDPNVMGLLAKDQTDQRYLFHWMLTFDLASIVKPGPVPHFNKSDLASVRLPMPTDAGERDEIVAIFDAIDVKIDLHKRKGVILEELFRALLHKLMTGEVHVEDLDLSALENAQEVMA